MSSEYFSNSYNSYPSGQSNQIFDRSFDNSRKDVEIDIVMDPNPNPDYQADANDQLKLTSLTSKFNFDFDELVEREEGIYAIEERNLDIVNDQPELDSRSFRDKMKFFSSLEKKAQVQESEKVGSQPVISSPEANEYVDQTNINYSSKPSFDPYEKEAGLINFEDDYDMVPIYIQTQPENIDLIKVSIVNKRPVTPDINDILNEIDEEQYLDRSLGFNEDVNTNNYSEHKRLSSLDPSIANEYEWLQEMSAHRAHKNQSSSAVLSDQRAFKDNNQSVNHRNSNPFYNETNIQILDNNRVSYCSTYENIDYSNEYSSHHFATSTEVDSGKRKLSPLNPFNENYLKEQPLNLANFHHQLEIQDKNRVVRIKDYSIINVVNSRNKNDVTRISTEEIVKIRKPDESRNIQKFAPSYQKIEISTVEKNFNELAKSRAQKHEFEDALFKNDLQEIKQVALRNLNKQTDTVKPQQHHVTPKPDTSKKEQRGIISIFSRFINVFRSPFSRKSDENSQKPKSTLAASTNKQTSEYKQQLISNQDEEYDDEEKEIRIFTITDIDKKRADEKSRKADTKITKSKTDPQLRDITPKEVARMRKSKLQSDDGKTSGWKCCLF